MQCQTTNAPFQVNQFTIPSLSKSKSKQKKHPKDKNPQHQISTENQEIQQTPLPKSHWFHLNPHNSPKTFPKPNLTHIPNPQKNQKFPQTKPHPHLQTQQSHQIYFSSNCGIKTKSSKPHNSPKNTINFHKPNKGIKFIFTSNHTITTKS